MRLNMNQAEMRELVIGIPNRTWFYVILFLTMHWATTSTTLAQVDPRSYGEMLKFHGELAYELTREETEYRRRLESEGKPFEVAHYAAARLRRNLAPRVLNNLEDVKRHLLIMEGTSPDVAVHEARLYRERLMKEEDECFAKAETMWNEYLEREERWEERDRKAWWRRFWILVGALIVVIQLLIWLSRRWRRRATPQ